MMWSRPNYCACGMTWPIRRQAMTDDEWRLLIQALPPDTPGMKTEQGMPGVRRALNGMLYRHHSYVTWYQVPRRYGDYKTIQVRYSNYRTSRVFARTLAALDGTPGAERLVEWLRHVEDGTSKDRPSSEQFQAT
ncbi:transposase [Streptomyces nigra]